MATGGPDDICDICSGKHQTSQAVTWCPECEEKHCKGCYEHHSISKVTRLHSSIDINDYRSIPYSVLEIDNFCNQHKMKYSNFCPKHDNLCCPGCTTGSGSHSECKTLLIREVIETSHTSNLLKSMQVGLKSLKKNIGSIIKDRQNNIQHLLVQRQEIEREINEIKETIVKQIHDIEKNALEDLNSRVMQKTSRLESEIKYLEKRVKKSESLLKSTSALIGIGTDVQTYIGSKTLETEVLQEINLLEDFVKHECLEQYGLKFRKNNKYKVLFGNTQLFGTVLDDTRSVSFDMTSELDKQAQILSRSSTVPNDDVKLSLKSTFRVDGDYNNICGCSVTVSGRIVLTNYGRSCVTILTENGDLEKEIKLSTKPYGMTVIDTNTIAVSNDKGVKIIDIDSGKKRKTLHTGTCYGVEHYNGCLICGVTGKGVISVDLTNNSMTTLVRYEDSSDTMHCTVYRDNIYLIKVFANSITCYSIKGELLWENKTLSDILCPLSIAVDNSSNVYVTSSVNSSVAVLSPDGKRSRTLLTEEDGISYPTALHFNRPKNQLMVFNRDGSGFLFGI